MPSLSELNSMVGFPVALFEFRECLSQFLAESETSLTIHDVFEGIGSPDVRDIVDSQLTDDAITETAYRQALQVDRPRLRNVYASYFTEHRLEGVIFPTSPVVARPIGDDVTIELNGERLPTFATYIRNTDPGSNAGIPGISCRQGCPRPAFQSEWKSTDPEVPTNVCCRSRLPSKKPSNSAIRSGFRTVR